MTSRDHPFDHAADRLPRVLAIAYACHPETSAESRVGWARVVMASRNHDVTVLCSADSCPNELQRLALLDGASETIRFVPVEHGKFGNYCYGHDLLHVFGYRLWHRAAARVAHRLHGEQAFDLVHQVNFCSYREPGYCWNLDVPFVWGPVGGTQYFPIRYLGVTDLYNGSRELARNLVNWIQLRLCRRVRRVARSKQSTILAATHTAKEHLRQHLGIAPRVELEAGLSYAPLPKRARRNTDEPLRILWTGRLRAWKGLPLLLHALAQLPEGLRYEVRVLGQGAAEPSLRRQAKKLGVASNIQWVGWGPYSETLPHYQWADLFAFTSLRDTSGAGLLEALAAGTPVVGLNHQGAADILDNTCAVLIEPTGPKDTVKQIAEAITQLHDDATRLEQLSHGATAHSRKYAWSARTETLDDIYLRALRATSAIAEPRRGGTQALSMASASRTYEQIA